MREVVYYRTQAGRSPIDEFLQALPPRPRGKIGWVLDVVRKGQPVPAEYLKKLPGTDGLWEIRATYGGDAFRLLCFFEGAAVVVVLTAFVKKTEATPLLEIQVAQQRRRDYLNSRSRDGG